MTYREAQTLYKKKFGKGVKSCYIADVLNFYGKTKRKAASRKGPYKYPCPKKVRPNLEKVLRELKML